MSGDKNGKHQVGLGYPRAGAPLPEAPLGLSAETSDARNLSSRRIRTISLAGLGLTERGHCRWRLFYCLLTNWRIERETDGRSY